MSYPIVLSFNAHDPTGGAGIAADALTCASLEASAFTVATTLLAGDFSRLEAVIPLDADWVDDQARYCREWLDGKLKGNTGCMNLELEDGQVALYSEGKKVVEGIVTGN